MNCCSLDWKLNRERILYKTDNFFVVPTKGPIGIEGYLLIIPNNHYLGFGMMPESLYREAEEVIEDVRKVIRSEYGLPVTVFEHGPRKGFESGACIDHAHLHVVPGVDITEDWASDMIRRLGSQGEFYRIDRVLGFEKARELSETEGSYLLMQNLDGERFVSEQNFRRPRQYFRRMVAANTGHAHWNWRNFPDLDIMKKTLDHLSGKF